MKLLAALRIWTLLIAGGGLCWLSVSGVQVPADPVIRLRWVKAHENEQWEQVKTGLTWSLSYLGAELPKGCLDKAISRSDSSLFSLDLAQVGFNEAALENLLVITQKLKESEEYEKAGGIDLGRFLLLTLHSSHHYYAITGAAKTYQEFIQHNDFLQFDSFAVLHSSVTKHNRVVKFRYPGDIRKLASVAEESSHLVKDGKFMPDVYEVFDMMPNGQLRFAIYNAVGNLIAASPKVLGAAGKPGKCMWCHESRTQPLYLPTDDVPGYTTKANFLTWADSTYRSIEQLWALKNTDLDFSKRQDHTYAELLYISFMEPSLYRLSNEWNLDTLELKTLLGKRETHIYDEFPFLGALYHRAEIDRLAPYKPLKVPNDVREENPEEPNYFNN